MTDRSLFLVLLGCLLFGLSPTVDAQDSMSGENPHGDLKGMACTVCHSTEAWTPLSSSLQFEHGRDTGYLLEGSHAELSCSECHGLEFAGLPSNCEGCHTDVHHGTAGVDCQRCHNQESWRDEGGFRRAHDSSAFPLTGAHRGLSCTACHDGQNFSEAPLECAGCHSLDYLNTSTPAHTSAGFSTDCSSCHSPTSNDWSSSFDHPASFPLSGGHSGPACNACHLPGIPMEQVERECSGCHNASTLVSDPDHGGSLFAGTCNTCHSTSAWNPAEFDHGLSRFPLEGQHGTTDCNACHQVGSTPRFTGLDDACVACHQTDADATPDPDHSGPAFAGDCATCHTPADWSPAEFDHELSNFQLTGAHVDAECAACHQPGGSVQYTGLDDACLACHQTVADETTDPDHSSTALSGDCAVCHTTDAWAPAEFDHALSTFALTGAHVQTDCNDCHGLDASPRFSGLDEACRACHQAVADETPDPDHSSPALGGDCAICHSTDAWTPADFDHNLARFPLTGAHINSDCASCHGEGDATQYSGLDFECVACHLADYDAAENPDHNDPALPTDCQVCHQTSAWHPAEFDHGLTDFPLTGAHTSLDCAACHTGGIYDPIDPACVTCHLDDYNDADDPDHQGEGLPLDCTLCHNTSDWDETTFDHSQTDFPLLGAHQPLACVACHAETWSGTPSACQSCHMDNWQQATLPHEESSFTLDCTRCHSQTAWVPSSFNHTTMTEWEMTGAHQGMACVNCHDGGTYTGTADQCWGCHQQDWLDADEPNHQQENYPEDCTICHSTQDWEATAFDHSQSAFPLVGAHVSVSCQSCHAQGYSGTPTACQACHEDDWDNATPQHDEATFQLDCLRCHTQSAWTPSTFDHGNMTDWPLTGSHVQTSCVACHSAGQYADTPDACQFCHMSDYNDANNPDHSGEGYPQDCTMCHNTTVWDPSPFNHDNQYFPVYTGEHRNEWQTCTDCHLGGGNMDTFSCTHCHEHRQSRMDSEHQDEDVQDYVWESSACFFCHPDGRADDRSLHMQPRPGFLKDRKDF